MPLHRLNSRFLGLAPLALAFVCFAFAATSGIASVGPGISAAADHARSDLDSALQELGALRERIVAEKAPMLESLSTLESEVAALQRDQERQLRLRDNREFGLERLRQQTRAGRDLNDYTAGLLDDFVSAFQTRIHFAETQLYGDTISEARLVLEDRDLDQGAQFAAQLAVLSLALDRLENLLGGYRFEGRALSPDGRLESGSFAVIGPSVYFASAESPLTGIAFTRVNAAEATIAHPGDTFIPGIRRLIETGEGTVPADASLGRALRIELARVGLFAHLAQGGYVGVVILALGALCLALAAFKFFDLRAVRTPAPEAIDRMVDALARSDLRAAEAIAVDAPTGAREILRTAVETHNDARDVQEELFYERILALRPRLERFLPFIAITAAAAPLLGLLGTVTGMIKTFNLITLFGTGDAKSLSSGISEALVTTELGLCVAIPALIIHGLLNRSVKAKLTTFEQSALTFLNARAPTPATPTLPNSD